MNDVLQKTHARSLFRAGTRVRALRRTLRTLSPALFMAFAIQTSFCADASQRELEFSSNNKGNIFPAVSGTVSLKISESAGFAEGKILVKNEKGDVLQEIAVPANAREIQVPLPEKGYYEIYAEMKKRDGVVVKSRASAAVIGPVLDETQRRQSRLGIWDVFADPAFALMGGGRWNRRMMSLKGNFGKPEYDRDFLKTADTIPVPKPGEAKPQESPFTNLGVFCFGLPSWMYDFPQGKPPEGWDPSRSFAAPRDWNELQKLVRACVLSLGQNCPPYFEVYNEPEVDWKGSKEDLAKFHILVAEAIKSVRPDVKVLGPCITGIRIKDPDSRFDLETANKLGMLDSLDGLSIHAYVDGTPPEGQFIERVLNLQNWLKKIGKDNLPIHLTEFGWTTAPIGGGEWQRPVDELTQAQYVSRSLTLLAAAGVENATYFCMAAWDGKHSPFTKEQLEGLDNGGHSIIHRNGTPKPAFPAFANVARWLAGVEGKGCWLHLTPSAHLVLFRKDASTVAVGWDSQGTREISLPFTVARASDMMGREIPAGKTLEFSPSPIFLELQNDAPFDLAMQPVMNILRGNSAAVPEGDQANWLVPSPLSVSGGKIHVPSQAPEGSYLLLAHGGNGWFGQPVDVVPAISMEKPLVHWSTASWPPSLVAGFRLNLPNPLSVQVEARFPQEGMALSKQILLSPGEKTAVALPLEKLVPGHRYLGDLTVTANAGETADIPPPQPLDLLLLTSFRIPEGAESLDWASIPSVEASAWTPPDGSRPDSRDFSIISTQFAHGIDGLHLRVRVRDNFHQQTAQANDMWAQDCIQIAFDSDVEKTWEANDLFGLKGHRIFEYGIGWTGENVMTWRWISYTPTLPPNSAAPKIAAKIERIEDITTYEIIFPWSELGLEQMPPAGSALGVALVAVDKDPGGPKRKILRLFDGIDRSKDPLNYGKLLLP